MENAILIVLIAVAFIIMLKVLKKKSHKRETEVAPTWAPPMPPAEYDYQNILNMSLDPEQFSSHQNFLRDTYSDSLLLGSSKDIVRDDPNDINPYLGLRRPNYDVPIGSGARQVPTEDQSQLPTVRAPTFV